MPSKRDPGKQGRQARNQARRQALATRRELASQARTEPARGPEAQASSGSRSARAPRRPASLGAGERPVGWRAALAGVLMAVVAFGLLATNEVTVDEDGEAIPTVELAPLYQFAQFSLGSGLETALEGQDVPAERAAAIEDLQAGPGDEQGNSLIAYWPVSLIFPMPVLIAGLAFWLVHRGVGTGRQLMFCLFGMFFASMMTGIFFLPSLIAVGIASFQVRKAEAAATVATKRAAAGGPAPGSEAADGDVIDVDEVDHDEDEYEDDDEYADESGDVHADDTDVRRSGR